MAEPALNILSIVAQLQDVQPERWHERLASITLSDSERKEIIRCLDRAKTAVNFLSGVGGAIDELPGGNPAFTTPPPSADPHVPQLDGYHITGRLGEAGWGSCGAPCRCRRTAKWR